MDIFLEFGQAEGVEFFLDKIFDGLDIMVGDLFGIFDFPLASSSVNWV